MLPVVIPRTYAGLQLLIVISRNNLNVPNVRYQSQLYDFDYYIWVSVMKSSDGTPGVKRQRPGSAPCFIPGYSLFSNFPRPLTMGLF